jgi:hypothetical protein
LALTDGLSDLIQIIVVIFTSIPDSFPCLVACTEFIYCPLMKMSRIGGLVLIFAPKETRTRERAAREFRDKFLVQTSIINHIQNMKARRGEK